MLRSIWTQIAARGNRKPGCSLEGDIARGNGGWSVWLSHSLRRLAWASCATTASVGSFPLLAVLIYVADEHPAFESTARVLAMTEAAYLEARRRKDL
jgi:hypothetical protein